MAKTKSKKPPPIGNTGLRRTRGGVYERCEAIPIPPSPTFWQNPITYPWRQSNYLQQVIKKNDCIVDESNKLIDAYRDPKK